MFLVVVHHPSCTLFANYFQRKKPIADGSSNTIPWPHNKYLDAGTNNRSLLLLDVHPAAEDWHGILEV